MTPVEAAMEVLGCERWVLDEGPDTCLVHEWRDDWFQEWTDAGCPVAVEVARVVGAAALDEAAELCIGCDHVTALAWCGICDQWRAALRARAAEMRGER